MLMPNIINKHHTTKIITTVLKRIFTNITNGNNTIISNNLKGKK